MLALAAAAALFVAFWGHAVPVGAVFLSVVSLVIGGTVAFVCLRHAGAAAVAVLAPLPGLLAAGPFALAGGAAYSNLLAAYALGYLVAICVSGDIVRRVLEGADAETAARGALADILLPAGVVMLAGAALVIGWLFRGVPRLGLSAAAELIAVTLSALLYTSFAATLLPFGESFFANANRTRERRESLVRLAARVVEPRWGMSLSGAALVVATLGGFAAQPVLAQPALWAASLLLLFLAAFAAGRDWRDALAATLALATLMLASLMLWGRVTRHLTAASFLDIATAAAAALFVVATMLWRIRSYRGDMANVARLRALEDMGLAPWFGALGGAAAILPWIVLHGSIAALAAMAVLVGAAGLIAMPALATALETLIPRRRSVDELYGRG
ncbi:MAG TPA: hypothetical protein VHZ78_05335 [Rhizomicrobium sp.]|nr:hypothetical protein [Rhizomicrobium sp.]